MGAIKFKLTATQHGWEQFRCHIQQFGIWKIMISRVLCGMQSLIHALSAKAVSRALRQKQVSRAETCNSIPQMLWNVITSPSPWYLFLGHHSAFRLTSVNVRALISNYIPRFVVHVTNHPCTNLRAGLYYLISVSIKEPEKSFLAADTSSTNIARTLI